LRYKIDASTRSIGLTRIALGGLLIGTVTAGAIISFPLTGSGTSHHV
jgi:hypothetical protein